MSVRKMKALLSACALASVANTTPLFASPVGGSAIATAAPDKPNALERFSPVDRRYAALYALDSAAVAGDLDDPMPAQLPDMRARWTALYERAARTMLTGTRQPHPLAGRALINLSLIAQIAGDAKAGRELAERGTKLLAPYRRWYEPEYAQGRTMLGYFLFAEGKATEALTILAPTVADLTIYVGNLAPAARTKTIYTLLSDAEYAYGQALARSGKVELAIAYQRRSLASLALAIGDNAGTVLVKRADLAVLLARSGQRDEAEQVARDAVERTAAHLKPGDPAYARVFAFTGLMLTRNGRREQGLAYIATALKAMRDTGSIGALGYNQIQQGYAVALTELERYRDALPILVASTEEFRKLGASFDRLKALSLVGVSRMGDGQTEAAATDLTAVLAGSRASDPRTREVALVTLPPLIVAEVDLGKIKSARNHARQYSADVAALDGMPTVQRAMASTLVAYVASVADPAALPDATAAARRMVDVVAEANAFAINGDLPYRERGALDLVLRIASASQDHDLALAAMGVLAGSRLAQANHLLVDRLVASDPRMGAAVRELQDATTAFRAADDAYLAALESGIERDARKREQTETAHRVAAERAALAADFPRWVEARGGSRTSVRALQDGLRPGEAMLGVIPAYDGAYVLAVGAKGARIERMQLGRAAVLDLVERVRTSLPLGRFDAIAAHALHSQIFTPGVRNALGDASALRIVATGAFAALPFAALIERPVARLDTATPWLVRRYALSVAPTFSLAPAQRRAPATAARFLGIGAPTGLAPTAQVAMVGPASRYYRGGRGDAAAVAQLPALPTAMRELNTAAKAYGRRATILTGNDASEARLRSMDLADYSVLLFATHGLVTGEMEGVTEPALVLTASGPDAEQDGLLTASEIGTLRLAADWVILSACNTAGAERVGAPAYSGLATAFRAAGGGSLLVSHWPVRDDASALLTTRTIANSRRGLSRAAALRAAMLTVMSSRLPDARDPYIWAPYVLIE